MELQGLLNGGQKGGAGALSGRAERNFRNFFRECRVDLKVYSISENGEGKADTICSSS